MRYSLLLFAAPALAFWRMECRGVLGNYRIDPLMSPGEASEHLHSFAGSSAFAANVTNDELLAGDCTSCLVKQDLSAYWHPALYFHDTDADTYELVGQQGGMLAYYLLNSNGDSITAFPSGFRMIAGDSTRRTYTVGNFLMVDPPKSSWASLNQTTQEALAQRAMGFNCLNYAKDPEGSLQRHYLPDKAFTDANCPDGLRLELMFPQCWDGKNVDSDNHADHVAYPDLVMSGNCPSTHPKRTPGLFYEIIWNTAAFASRNGEFTLSNGDRQGFSYHGDFMMGWNESLLQEAVDTCTSSSGLIADCPVFDIQTQAEAQTCKMKAPAQVASDDTGESTAASSLPGSHTLFGDLHDGTMISVYDDAQATTIPITNTGGAIATTTASSSTAATSTPATTTSTSTSSSTSASAATKDASLTADAAHIAALVDSITFATSSSTSSPLPSPSTSTSSSTTTPPPPPPSQTNTRVFSTQYITSAGAVQEILWEQTTQYVTAEPTTEWTTTTVTADANALHRRQHGHMRRHQNRYH